MSPEKFATKTTKRCAQGTGICALDVIAKLTEVASLPDDLDIDREEIGSAILSRAKKCTADQLNATARALGM